ncbi:hypothetical protein C8Q78DRAFT_106898 [Trametes maxima]|nr:hypothetical protein C8Q78DRAFT_106898 [Trametes maxima]
MASTKPPRECASSGCSTPATKRCAGCRNLWYCSEPCQKKHWPSHIFECQLGKPISPVYYLLRACREDALPMEPSTRKLYGFDRAGRDVSGETQRELLALYADILITKNIAPKVVKTWSDGRLLADGITGVYEALRPADRGALYAWFQKNQCIINPSTVPAPLSGGALEDAHAWNSNRIRNAWVLTGGSPADDLGTIVRRIRAAPPHVRACHSLYKQIVGKMCPNPDMDDWLTFAFVVSPCLRGREGELCVLYDRLIRKCSFDEFCAAYQASKMFLLFAVYDIPDAAIIRCDRYRDVMAGSPYHFKSVWWLKQYVDILHCSASGTRPKLHQSAVVDYGYANCRNEGERKLLDDTYKRLFTDTEAEPMYLHRACMEGRLFQYVGEHVKLKPWTDKFKRLLKNPYPPVDA